MSIRETNTLMNASAGTGKTFWLASHNIRLMLLGKRPAEITALTFSRAAAEEIYVKIADRLAAASSDAGAMKESETIFQNLSGKMRENLLAKFPDGKIPKEAFVSLLRMLINDQYLGTISTIDSFIWRLVRIFPLELGIQGRMNILDEYGKAAALKKVCSGFFQDPEDSEQAKEFAEAFSDALNNSDSRDYGKKLDDFIENWRNELLANQGCACGDPSVIWQDGGIPFQGGRPQEEIANDLQNLTEDLNDAQKPLWQKFVDCVRIYGPSSSLPAEETWFKNICKGYSNASERALPLIVKLARKDAIFMGTKADIIREGLEAIIGMTLQSLVQRMKGIGLLMKQIEDRYDATTRRTGKLTFDDLPRLFNSLNGVDRLNIEYRFDEKTNHWALDEFQDTSRPQWRAMENLVDEAVQNEEKTVSVVGDIKQAIYGWRQGDSGIFRDLNAKNEFTEPPPLSVSFRYGPAIAEFVNHVFGKANLASMPFLDTVAKTLEHNWISRWKDHVSSRRECDDFVKIIGVTREEGKQRLDKDDYIKAAILEITAVRKAHPQAVVAILVRTNQQGDDFAQALKMEDIPVVWEGENAVCDTPVVQAFLHLLHLSEHPEDPFDAEFLKMTPLLSALAAFWGENSAATPKVAARMVSQDVNKLGLARALQQYTASLDKELLNEFTQKRLDSMVRSAVEFENGMDEQSQISDFAEYLARQQERDYASPESVKILSIHRSKGLGFDYVLLPVIEQGSIEKPDAKSHLLAEDRTWAMPHIPGPLLQLVPAFQKAYHAQCAQALIDNLCMYYVATTRAKNALTILVKAQSSSKETLYFSDIIKLAYPTLPYMAGNENWKENAEKPSIQPPATQRTPEATNALRERKKKVAFVTPSGSFGAGEEQCAAALFTDPDDEMRTRGIEIHASFAKIAWIQTAEELAGLVNHPAGEFLAAFQKTADTTGLWRERSFEIANDNEWLTGQFDRVVFYGSDKAIVYDFKTNHIRDGEDNAAFLKRMVETYGGQMRAYREAVTKLTGRKDVKSYLLLTATGTAAPI